MTRFGEKSFTVAVGARDARDCRHGWTDARGRCVLCGASVGGGIVLNPATKALMTPTVRWTWRTPNEAAREAEPRG